jgi:hypothetical protein
MTDFLANTKTDSSKQLINYEYEYYELPENYSIYRGDNSLTLGSRFNNKRPLFFGTSEAAVKQYGMAFEIKTDRIYKLLAIDNQDTIDNIYDSIDEDIDIDEDQKSDLQKILNRNYGRTSGIRDSINESDVRLSKYLCKKGFDGYAIKQLKTDAGGFFHEEGMICEPASLQIHKQLTPETERRGKLEEQNIRQHSESLKDSRKKRQPNSSLFGSPAKSIRSLFESPVKSISNSLFADSPEPESIRRSYDSPVKSNRSLFPDSPDKTPPKRRNGGKRSRKMKSKKTKQIKSRKNKKH